MGATKNVLLVANFAPQTGYAWWLMEDFWLQIQRIVESRAGQCLLIYPDSGDPPSRVADSSIEVAVHDFGDRSVRSLARLHALIRSRDIGTVYLTDRGSFDWLYLLLRLWGVRRIILHDHTPGERPKPPTTRWLAKRLLHELRVFSCDLNIGVSAFVARRMVEVGGVPRRRVTYVHNGVIPRADAIPASSIRQSVGIGPRGVLVANVGRAHRYKGIDFMIDVAADLVRRGHRDVGFVHVGDGPHLAEFKERAVRRGVQDRFHFAGRMQDVYPVLAASDIAFHTSHGEAFSLAVLEYMAAGLPVVLPDHCGNREAVQDRVDGVLYEPGNLEDAACKLSELIEHPRWREQLGAAARTKVHREFRLDICERAFRRVMEGVLLPEGPPARTDAEGAASDPDAVATYDASLNG